MTLVLFYILLLDPSEWIVQTKGWALSHNISVAKQKVAMGVTKNFAGKGSADRPSSDRFEQRFKYFLAKNKRNKQFVIEASGAISVEERLHDMNNDPINDDEYFVSEIDDDSDDLTADMNAAAAIESFFTPSSFNNSCNTRRSSAESNDSGFQSSPADDDNEIKLVDDFYYEQVPPPMIDSLLAARPGNPLSTVLDGGRKSYSASTASFRSSGSNGSLDDFDNNQFTIGSLESSSSSSSEEDNISKVRSASELSQLSSSKTEYKVNVTTESSGFLNGEIVIPDSRIQSWAKEHDQCTTRTIRLKSSSETFKPSFGLVSLVEPKGISIISDIDDTIKDTQILAGARTVLSNTFFKQSRDVPGMADAYMHWYTQGASFHYVSNSPFQLMPMLDRFIKSCDFPPGSMHLRVDGKLLARLVEVPGRAKRDAILQIMKDFPQRQFVLIGDSGEIDLEIYATIAREQPDRILKIFIRDVSSKKVEGSLARRNTFTAMFTPGNKQKQQQQQGQRPPNSVNSNDVTSRRAATLGDMVSVSSVSLQSRVARAKQTCSVDIVVFQDAEVLKNDSVIRDALWKSLDEQPSSM
ncbi:hypothetical protein BDB00DRAFT_809495 [Zychaea mexicana]|uniref:uncharacterized protein n=1 Tax=Zychaea mexicana TaxID=64656 RepID=UPI0022FE5889|nr:uncharacterized protein BDB00DRAFT_809495 [Zychaea mexicana]KAI9496204.1 hypothetical protein BDB00DRAFT_809495 [Zychaea mexicana]